MIPDLSQFHLMRPEWLWALAPAAVLVILLWRARRHSGGWSDVIAPELLPFLVGNTTAARGRNLLPFILIGWILAAVAASGPSWEKIPQPVVQKRDAMLLVLDLSYSMKAGDLPPSRLDRARQKLLDLLEMRREGQTGLIAYAGDSHIVTPLTDDNQTIANLLPVLSPDMMPVPGSNTPAAIRQAIELMHSAGIAQGQIVLITDGVSKPDREAVGELLDGSNMQLTVLAVGTDNGAPIPLNRGGFLKDSQDAIVIPKLDRSALESMARAVGGRYLSMQIDDSDIDQILNEPFIPDQEQTLALDRTADAWDDQGYLLVLLLIPLVLPLFRRGWIVSLVPLLLFGSPEMARAQTWDNLWRTPDQQAKKALEAGDTDVAESLFEDAAWAGTAAYQGENYESAARHFSKGETASHWYNRGNALARAGEIDEAIEAYKESLALQPEQIDAVENLALLEELKKQQQQQQQNDQDQDQDQDRDQDQDQEQSDEEKNESDQQQDQDSQQDEQQSNQDSSGDPEDEESSSEEQPPEDPAEEESDEPGEDQEQEQEQPENEQPEDDGQEQEQETAEAEAEEASPEDQEEEQAMQQWLRRIPDDPSGLLREKFRYESRQRQEQGDERQNETNW